MSRHVFVDSSAWLAMLNQSDSLHQRAVETRDQLDSARADLFTTEYVLIEVADALCPPQFRKQVILLMDSLIQDGIIEIIPSSNEFFARGWKLYKTRADKSWSLTDCISFAVMESLGTAEALTSDRHFEQAGFVKLL